MSKQSDLIEEVKWRLDNFRLDEEELDFQQERLERLNAKMLEVGAQVITDMPRAPSTEPDRITDYIIKKDQLEKSVSDLLDRHSMEREMFEQIITRGVRQPSRRAVIRIRYLDARSWNDVVDIMFGGKTDFTSKEESYLRRVHRLEGEALENMAEYIASTTDKKILQWIM